MYIFTYIIYNAHTYIHGNRIYSIITVEPVNRVTPLSTTSYIQFRKTPPMPPPTDADSQGRYNSELDPFIPESTPKGFCCLREEKTEKEETLSMDFFVSLR